MSINLISVSYVYDDKKKKYVFKKDTLKINPNLEEDIKTLKEKFKTQKGEKQ